MGFAQPDYLILSVLFEDSVKRATANREISEIIVHFGQRLNSGNFTRFEISSFTVAN